MTQSIESNGYGKAGVSYAFSTCGLSLTDDDGDDGKCGKEHVCAVSSFFLSYPIPKEHLFKINLLIEKHLLLYLSMFYMLIFYFFKEDYFCQR